MIIKEKSIKNYKNLENAMRYILSKEANDGFVHTRFILGDRKKNVLVPFASAAGITSAAAAAAAAATDGSSSSSNSSEAAPPV